VNPRRRALKFSNLDQVMPDVDNLLRGNETVGNWTLGQICNHLTKDFRGSLEGYEFTVPWIFRTLFGPVARKNVFQKAIIPEGARVPKIFLPNPGLDDRAEAEALRAAIHIYTMRKGPLSPHPFFGKLTDNEWNELFCLHCSHHLSFALPKSPA
jgi:hypothetical protein